MWSNNFPSLFNYKISTESCSSSFNIIHLTTKSHNYYEPCLSPFGAHYHLFMPTRVRNRLNDNIIVLEMDLPCALLYALITDTVLTTLLVVQFHISPVLTCNMEEVCEMLNTRGDTRTYREIAWKLNGTMTCEGYCMQLPRCVASTSDPSSQSCVLHEADGDGWPCVILTEELGPAFKIKMPPGRPCPTVREGSCFFLRF